MTNNNTTDKKKILIEYEDKLSDFIIIDEMKKDENIVNILSKSDWDNVIKQKNINIFSHKDIYYSLLKGIKFDTRKDIWLLLANVEKLKEENYKKGIIYNKLRQNESSSKLQIVKDISRTYVDQKDFQKADFHHKLYDILNAYANFDPEIGYTQGMNFIVAALLIHLNPDNDKETVKDTEIIDTEFNERVFWILVHIMKEKQWDGFFRNGTPQIFIAMEKLENQMKIEIPQILEHIQNNYLQVTTLFCQYYFTIMLYNCPQEFGKRILDLFLLEGQSMINDVIINMCKICQEEILQKIDLEELMCFFKVGILQRCSEKFLQENKKLDEGYNLSGKSIHEDNHIFQNCSVLNTCQITKIDSTN